MHWTACLQKPRAERVNKHMGSSKRIRMRIKNCLPDCSTVCLDMCDLHVEFALEIMVCFKTALS